LSITLEVEEDKRAMIQPIHLEGKPQWFIREIR
jgi:hypothetical protein